MLWKKQNKFIFRQVNNTNFLVHTYYYKYGHFILILLKNRKLKMVRTEFDNNTLTAFLSGEIDHNCASSIRNQIDGQAENLHPKTLKLDFSKVSFMDSSGIGLIMGRYRTMSLLGGNLKIVNIPQRLQKIVELSGVGALGVLK